MSPRPSSTVAELLGDCLRAAGATRAFGVGASDIAGLRGLGHVAVEDVAEATMLAAAAGRIGTGPGVAAIGQNRLLLTSAPGAEATEVRISDVAELAGAVATWSWDAVHAAVELVLDVDLDAPAPPDAEPLAVDASATEALFLGSELRGIGMVVLAGPGVVRADAVDDLVAFARRSGCGVLNTWGAKGVLRWSDPLHLGTIGLQRDDFSLAGLVDAPVVVAVGIDPAEAPPQRWAGPAVLEVAPSQLALLADRWPEEPPDAPPRPALYEKLAALFEPASADDSVPLHPARAVADLAKVARARRVSVFADPGPAGLWVARTFPTVDPGSVVVPAHPAEGFAVAAAMVASLDGRRSVAVLTDPTDPLSTALVERATTWGTDATIVHWGAESARDHADAHRDALVDAVDTAGIAHLGLPVELSRTRELVELAGPVAAWL